MRCRETDVVSQSAVEETSKFDNIGISIANNYVNIRKKANEESKVIGKLYKGAAATILETDGQWVKIESGSCTGYINQDFLATGLRAEELADEYGEKIAMVTATTLKVREKADAEASCLTMIPIGETYEVVKETDEWVKIKVDEEVKGYVSKEYVDVDVKFEKAISIKEEKEKLRREEEERKAAEEAARAAAEEEAARVAAEEAARAASSSSSNSSSSSANSSSSKASKSTSSSKSTTSSRKSSSSGSSNGTTVKGSGSGSAVASYALQFVGNPYVWGGSSLTSGADCSGFVMAVYAHFGVSLPHSSSSQAGYGTSVSLSNVQPGDLVFYGKGGINHVAIYIGGGRVVHAKGKQYGITTDAVGYSF